MKRFNRTTSVVSLLLLTFSLNVNADNTPKQLESRETGQDCVTVIIQCANGKGTIYNGCGTSDEIAQDIRDVMNYMCK